MILGTALQKWVNLNSLTLAQSGCFTIFHKRANWKYKRSSASEARSFSEPDKNINRKSAWSCNNTNIFLYLEPPRKWLFCFQTQNIPKIDSVFSITTSLSLTHTKSITYDMDTVN